MRFLFQFVFVLVSEVWFWIFSLMYCVEDQIARDYYVKHVWISLRMCTSCQKYSFIPMLSYQSCLFLLEFWFLFQRQHPVAHAFISWLLHRAAYNLLGYNPNITTFKPRTLVKLWTGGIWPEWKVRYKLFKKFRIVNAKLLREDARRDARHERKEPSINGGKKRKRASKPPTLTIVVVGRSTGLTRMRLLLEEEEDNGLAAEEVTIDAPPIARSLSAKIQPPLWECLRTQDLKTQPILVLGLPWILGSTLI